MITNITHRFSSQEHNLLWTFSLLSGLFSGRGWDLIYVSLWRCFPLLYLACSLLLPPWNLSLSSIPHLSLGQFIDLSINTIINISSHFMISFFLSAQFLWPFPHLKGQYCYWAFSCHKKKCPSVQYQTNRYQNDSTPSPGYPSLIMLQIYSDDLVHSKCLI